MKKLGKIKNIYFLSALIVGILLLITYTTYSLYANVVGSSTEPISLNTVLNYTFDITSDKSFVINANTTVNFNATIKNDMNGELSYKLYHTLDLNSNANVIVAEVVSDATLVTVAPNTSGLVSANSSKTIPIVIKNTSSSNVNVNIGVVMGYANNVITLGSDGNPSGYEITSTFDDDNLPSFQCAASELEIGENCIITYVTDTIHGESQLVEKIQCPIDSIANDIINLSVTNTSEIWTITQPATTRVDHQTTEYRYYGATPNNYVYYNCQDTYSGINYGETNYDYASACEKWRIIGVFETETPVYTNGEITSYKTENRVKIIRDESIGNYSYDSSATDVNSGYGINAWDQADLMTTLNTGSYWNRTSGTCYNGRYEATTSCDFSTTGLTTTAKALVEPAKYYLGGTENNQLTSVYYVGERGTTYKTCTSGDRCNDTYTRQGTWTGYVGLMYASDYGYAAGSTCANNTKLGYNSSTGFNVSCYNNDWLYKSSITQWTLSPSLYSSYATNVFYMSSIGTLGSEVAYCAYVVRPVLYLSSEVVIKNGLGTSGQPFVLGR